MNTSVKKVLHWGGSALACAGIAFVLVRLYELSKEADLSQLDGFSWARICVWHS
jgi:hypothetical protein